MANKRIRPIKIFLSTDEIYFYIPGNYRSVAVHGCKVGPLYTTFPNAFEERSAIATGSVMDAAFPPSFGTVVYILEH